MAKARKNTQEQFAKLVGISQPEVSKLQHKGVLTRGAPIGQQLQEYLTHLRAVAAQWRSEDSEIDIVKERALLDRRKRELIEIELAQLRQDLWPTKAIGAVLHQEHTNAKNRWLFLPNSFKSFCPHIAARDIDVLDRLVRENLTQQTNDQLPPDIRHMVQRYFDELHAAAEADGEPVVGPLPAAEPRKQRGARAVANGAHAVPKKNHGRGK